MPAVSDSSCQSRQHLGVSLPIEQYGGILIGVMQHSGTTLDVLDDVVGSPEGNLRPRSLFSMHRISTLHAPGYSRICPDPE